MATVFLFEKYTEPLQDETYSNCSGTVSVTVIAFISVFALFAIVLFVFIKSRKIKIEMPRQKDKVIAAVFETAGQFTYVYAMSGNGVISATIISSVCVFSLLLSRIFLKEKLSAKQYLFIIIVILGILLLAVAEEL